MAPRPAFTQNYGGTWFDSVSQAQDLLITGVARNTLVRNQYEALKERLLAGRTMRILLIDPDSPALLAAADR